MQHNTPFDPPTSEFPFGPCQQRRGPSPEPTLNVSTGCSDWKTPQHRFLRLFFTRDNKCYQLPCKFSSATEALWLLWVVVAVWLVRRDQTCWAGTTLCARDKSTPESMWSLQGTACALAPSPGRLWQGKEGGRERGRLDGKWRVFKGRVKVWGRERGGGTREEKQAGSCRDKLLFVAQRCTRCLHVSVTWPSTLQETPAAFTWEVNVKTHTDQNTTLTHTSSAFVCIYVCTKARINCPVQMHLPWSNTLSLDALFSA